MGKIFHTIFNYYRSSNPLRYGQREKTYDDFEKLLHDAKAFLFLTNLFFGKRIHLCLCRDYRGGKPRS